MAQAIVLTEAQYATIASQLVGMLSFAGSPGDFLIGETLPISSASFALVPGAESLQAAARELRAWHHQLHTIDRTGVLSVTSSRDDEPMLRVHAVGNHALARQIRSAIPVLDARFADTTETVHLLNAPAYHVRALWLREAGAAYVLSGPRHLIAESRLIDDGSLLAELKLLHDGILRRHREERTL